jgi:DNA-binding CsgD family transcriptional regulator
MPFSEIKIDRSFVSDVTTSRDSRAIVKSVIDLAANMKMDCVAEGVETEETADLLEQLGISDLQGYLIAHPMPVEAVPPWLALWTQTSPRTVQGPTAPPVRELVATASMGTSLPPPGLRSEPVGSHTVRLSTRQLEVMQALAEGCSVKEIARRLDIGVGTVKVHLSLAYSALGARNRIEAIRLAGPAFLSRLSKQRTTT